MWKWLKTARKVFDINLRHGAVDSIEALVLTKEYKRARTKRGRYKGDDKSTPNINEAWVGGKSPKKKRKVYKIKGKKYVLKKTIRSSK
mgnify:CR=1 FL=1|jgi:hypothetical protein|tara:strand:+ start:138 stop:401 length:264 start_codon:yes stop_codon:yes gene_type:complete